MDSYLRELQEDVKTERTFSAALRYIKALEHELKIPEADRYKDGYEGWRPLYPAPAGKAYKCRLCEDDGQITDAYGAIKDCPCGAWYPNKYPDM